jgi:hypothetical protein
VTRLELQSAVTATGMLAAGLRVSASEREYLTTLLGALAKLRDAHDAQQTLNEHGETCPLCSRGTDVCQDAIVLHAAMLAAHAKARLDP